MRKINLMQRWLLTSGLAFVGAASAASATAYVWNFDSSNLGIAPGSGNGSMNYRGNTQALTFFESTGSTYPNINGQVAKYLRHDAPPGTNREEKCTEAAEECEGHHDKGADEGQHERQCENNPDRKSVV